LFGLPADFAALNSLRIACFIDATKVRVGTLWSGVFSGFSIGLRAMTLIDLTMMFPTDAQCRELLERLRWPDGPACPRCQDTTPARLATNAKLLYCRKCDYQFSVTTGTILHDSHLPLLKWFTVVLLMCEAKKGISALQVKRTVGMARRTAWYLCMRIRHAMASAAKEPLTGKVEVDETYVGGKNLGRGWLEGRDNKEVVIGIRQRGGDLRFFHAEDAKSGTLAAYIKEHISEDVEVIMTDEWMGYPAAMKKTGNTAKHKTIQHKGKVYVNGDIHTNTVESAFSLLKRGIVGSWHKVSAKHLTAYLEEMTFRFNRRNRSDLFLDTLRHMVTADPLTFEDLTA
jgi:transposase-like protein